MLKDSSKYEYQKRINNVLDYINYNLDKELNLSVLSRISCFSKYHFHRIFYSLIEETPEDYVRRIRLEKAANLITSSQILNITDIAFNCGFTSSSLFSRIFKNHFKMSPYKFKKYSKNSKEFLFNYKYNNHKIYQGIQMEAHIKTMQKYRVAYIKHFKGYNQGIKKAYDTLFRWAIPKGYVNDNTKIIGISFDNPEVTPDFKCRYYACITVEKDITPDGEIGITEIPSGKYAVFHYEGKKHEIAQAYNYIYDKWLPESNYEPGDFPSYEFTKYSEKYRFSKNISTDICLPIIPL